MQTCVVHLVLDTLRYASNEYWSTSAKQLRVIYTALTVEAAEAARSSPSTGSIAIESLNARFSAATRRRGHFPDEQAAFKVLCWESARIS